MTGNHAHAGGSPAAAFRLYWVRLTFADAFRRPDHSSRAVSNGRSGIATMSSFYDI
jgi:hypothetical protein